MTTYATHHPPTAITWDHDRTRWLRAVPLAFGEIASSRPRHAAHRVMVRLDGSGAECSCEAGGKCTLERDSDATAAAFWADWARRQDGDTLERTGREISYQHATCGIEPWMRLQNDSIGDEVWARTAEEAA